MDWTELAACKNIPPDLKEHFFLPEKHTPSHAEWFAPALTLCAKCPVRADCLADGDTRREDRKVSVYGGLSPMSRTTRHPHGTLGASAVTIAKHLFDGGPIGAPDGNAMGVLAEQVGWKPFRIHNVIPDLEQRGFVRREGSQRSYVLIELTFAGLEALERTLASSSTS